MSRIANSRATLIKDIFALFIQTYIYIYTIYNSKRG